MSDTYATNRKRLKETKPWRCALCGFAIKEKDLSVDHIVPLSRGGDSSLSNLRLLHSTCNQIKGDLLDEELSWLAKSYFAWLKFLSLFFPS